MATIIVNIKEFGFYFRVSGQLLKVVIHSVFAEEWHELTYDL